MSEPDHWEGLADRLGSSYLRYSFTKGTAQEVEFLVAQLGLRSGMTVLDVGCGPGRHAYALAERGIRVTGVDIAQRFIDLATESAPPGATFVRGDARHLTFDDQFDAAISLCQGGMGLGGVDPIGSDLAVLDGMRRSVHPGAPIAVSAFNAYFQVRWLEDSDTFDAAVGVNHETTEIRNESGTAEPAELWTTCSTPRELRLLFDRAGLEVDQIWSVEPGKYAANPASITTPELLAIGRRPG